MTMLETTNNITKSAGSRFTARRVAVVIGAIALVGAFWAVSRHGYQVERLKDRGFHAYVSSIIWHDYALSNDGLLPPWDPRPGYLMYDRALVVPAYRVKQTYAWDREPETTPALLGNLDEKPALALTDYVNDQRYFYLPYAVTNEEEGMALVEAYREQVRKGGTFEDDLPAPPGLGTGGSDRFYRCRYGLYEVMKADGAENRWNEGVANVSPVYIERPKPDKDRLWMVYLSRHPVHLPYPGDFPMTERFLNALAELEAEMRAKYEPPEPEAEASGE